MKRYINRKGDGYLDTVEEMEINNRADWKELKRLLSEYSLADWYGEYYISQRCCKDWREEE